MNGREHDEQRVFTRSGRLPLASRLEVVLQLSFSPSVCRVQVVVA